jgi:hypothetical protein
MQDIQRLAETDPGTFLGRSFMIAYRAHRASDWKLLELIDELRLKAYSSLHLRLPSVFATPSVLFMLVLAGYYVSFVSVRFDAPTTAVFFFAGLIMVTLFSHPLGHSIFAELGRFETLGCFLGGRIGVEPTILLSLRSYYERSAKGRFWLHISGALFTLFSSLLFVPLVYLDGFSMLYRYFTLVFFGAVVLSEVFHSSKKGDIRRAIRSRRMV